jgi:hypothetical protein
MPENIGKKLLIPPNGKNSENRIMKSFKNTLSQLLKALVAVGLIWLIIGKTGFTFKEFLDILKGINLWMYSLALPGVLIVLWLKSRRWHYLMKTEGIHYDTTNTYKSYLTSYSIGLLTPGRFGEIVRVYYIRDLSEGGLFKAFQTVIADRFFDLYFVLGGGLLSYALLLQTENITFLWISVMIVIFGLLILWVLLYCFRNKNQKHNFISFLYGSLYPITGIHSMKNWLLTVFAYMIYFLQSYLIAKALNFHIGFWEMAGVIIITSAVLLIPITWAGFGTRELSLVVLLAHWGISSESAMAFSLLQFVATFFIGGITGLVIWFSHPIPREALKKDYESIKQFLKFRKN